MLHRGPYWCPAHARTDRPFSLDALFAGCCSSRASTSWREERRERRSGHVRYGGIYLVPTYATGRMTRDRSCLCGRCWDMAGDA